MATGLCGPHDWDRDEGVRSRRSPKTQSLDTVWVAPCVRARVGWGPASLSPVDISTVHKDGALERGLPHCPVLLEAGDGTVPGMEALPSRNGFIPACNQEGGEALVL